MERPTFGKLAYGSFSGQPPWDYCCRLSCPIAAFEVAAVLRSSLSKALSEALRMVGGKQHRKNLGVSTRIQP